MKTKLYIISISDDDYNKYTFSSCTELSDGYLAEDNLEYCSDYNIDMFLESIKRIILKNNE